MDFQLRIVSTSAAKRIFWSNSLLTLYVEVVAVADGGFEEDSD